MAGGFDVDSFFDVTSQIDFVGAPGGALDGLSGTTAERTLMGLPSAVLSIPALSRSSFAVLIAVLFLAVAFALVRRRRSAIA